MSNTAKRFEEIRERLRKASSEPWVEGHTAAEIRQPNVSRRRKIQFPPDANGFNDAEFTRHARSDIPFLISYAEQSEGRRYTMEDELRDALGVSPNQKMDWDDLIKLVEGHVRMVEVVIKLSNENRKLQKRLREIDRGLSDVGEFLERWLIDGANI